jgi:hypothetical protein
MSYDDQAASHYGYRIDGNGMAVNPATGKLESLYAAPRAIRWPRIGPTFALQAIRGG